MSDVEKNIRIPVPESEGKHTKHRVRTITINSEKGIKALYCMTDKKNITYIFALNKGWIEDKAKEWMLEHEKHLVALEPIEIDQIPEFLKLLATFDDGTTADYLPNSQSFVLDKAIEPYTTGLIKARGDGQGTGGELQGDGGANNCECPSCGYTMAHNKGTPCSSMTCPSCGNMMVGKSLEKDVSEESIEIIKVSKQKQIVYGVFLVPDKADHDGDVVNAEDIEKVAHGFIAEYRTIDEMHKNIITADIVESGIAWKDNLNYYGKKLTKGTWFGAIHIKDLEIWEKVLSGEYKAFSVRIAGVREDIEVDNE